MGGYGSGRWGSRKPTAEQLKRLDLARLCRDGSLRPGTVSRIGWSRGGEEAGDISVVTDGDTLRLMYRTRNGDGPWRDIDERVCLTWTKTRFGGRRQWFCCLGCGRLCRVLFGGSLFRCRHCHKVRYSSQAETRADRATRAMFKIVHLLDPTAQINELPSKPKGMHWRTYERLAERYDGYDAEWGLEVMRRFGFRP